MQPSLFDGENEDILNEQTPPDKPFDYLNELNKVQRAAVEQTEGPVMIIAGPGSGKTRVLTYRIAHLINLGKAPYNLLSLTFTNKAAREMKERIEQIVGGEAAQQLWMGTFHSIFARILRIEAQHLGYPTNFTIYDTEDTKKLIAAIVKERGFNSDIYKPNVVYSRISNAKNKMISPAAYQTNLQLKARDEIDGLNRIEDLYALYIKRCRRAGAMDFDDLLLNMYYLLAKFPEVLQKYQHKFRYILIDEFQDTNFVQYAIVKKLVGEGRNICVVGDDAQSIYAFRGATIRNILNFEKDYPKLNIYKLEQNYRSTKNIVQVANTIIKNNKNQIAKQIWTSNQEGQKINLIKAATDTDEGKLVADSIYETRLRHHFKNEEFAILYRTNAQSRIIEEALRRRGIGYKVYGGLSFFQRKEIKDMMAYLRLTVNPHDEEALRRVINYPKRGIGKATIDKIAITADKMDKPIWDILLKINGFKLATRTKKSIISFVNLIRNFKQRQAKESAYELAKYIGRLTGLVQELHNDKTVEGLSRFENLEELFNSIKEFVDNKVRENLEKPNDRVDDSLGAYLQEVSLLTSMDTGEESAEQVKLMTVHSAKGLEFPCVYIIGLEDKLFPSARSMKSVQDLEEERRLFYVAVTRAKEKLVLSAAMSRRKFGAIQYSDISRFVQEIDPNYLKIVGGKPTFSGYKSDSYDAFKKSENIRNSIKNAKNQQQKKPIAPIKDFKPSNPADIQVNSVVVHNRFGKGTVLSIDGRGDRRMAIIAFEHAGEKRILVRYAKLMIVG